MKERSSGIETLEPQGPRVVDTKRTPIEDVPSQVPHFPDTKPALLLQVLHCNISHDQC